MTIPVLDIPQISAPVDEKASFQTFVQSLHSALKSYPHWVVINGYGPGEDRAPLVNLTQAIASVGVEPSTAGLGASPRAKVSFTKVQINPAKSEIRGGVTQYSRTHLPLAPHTDSSYMARPHELVAFQCIVADQAGGDSIMIPLEDLLARLDDTVIAHLREPAYPLGDRLSPILFGDPTDLRIRYYRAQVDRNLAAGAPPLFGHHRAALEALDAVLQQTEQFSQFHLQAGQIVLMHNQKVLHGRTGFSPESERLIYRVRLHIDSLSAPPSAAAPASDLRDQIDEQVSLAIQLERSQRFDEALEHYRYATELAPDDTDLLHDYGQLLLRTGKFAASAQAFLRCLKLDPNDYDSGIALSSLAHAKGEDETAKNILEAVTRRHPYVFTSGSNPRRPTLLKVRGLDASAYSIIQKADGTFKQLLRGGHFSLGNLINKSQYNLITLNVFENNTDALTEIPDFDLLLNVIACPDLKRASLLAAARFADRYPHIPVINDPCRVLETTRERNALRLNLIPGVSFPKTERVYWDGASVETVIQEIMGLGFVFPMIVRRVGSQTGSSVALLQDEAALSNHFQQSPPNQEYYVIQFKDCRRSQNVYNKTRVFCIDGTFYPVANLFNDSWNIHSGDRYSLMDKTPWTQEEEQAFLNDPVSYLGRETFDKFEKIREMVGLDFFGIDLTLLPDGTLFIFELNAAMRHNFDHAGNFPYTAPHLQRVSQAFDAMVQRRLQVSQAAP